MRVLKWALIFIVSLVVLTALSLTVAYFAIDPPERVPATVSDNPTLPRLELSDVVLHAEVFGDENAPVIIALHGGPGNDYRSILPLQALADTYRVVFYDQRGAGLSERVAPSEITLEKYYQDLDQIIERFAPGQAVRLIGHSWGAMLATGYMGRHPERVERAVLIEPGMLTPETAALFMKKTNNMMPPMSVAALKVLVSAWLKSLHINGPDPQAPIDYLARRVMTSNIPGHPIAGYFCDADFQNAALDDWRFGALAASTLLTEGSNDRGEFTIDFAKGIKKYQREVLLLAGSCNTIIGKEHQQLHRALFPNARLVEVDGVGHTMIGEAPDRVLAIVREHLKAEQPAKEDLTLNGES